MTAPVFTGVGVALRHDLRLVGSRGRRRHRRARRPPRRARDEARCSSPGRNGEAASLDAEERALLVAAVRAALPRADPGARRLGSSLGAPGLPPDKGRPRRRGRRGARPVAAAELRRPPVLRARRRGGRRRTSCSRTTSRPSRRRDCPSPCWPSWQSSGIKDSSGDLRRLYDELEVFSGLAVHGLDESRPAGGRARVRRRDPRHREPRAGAGRARLCRRREGPAPARRGHRRAGRALAARA